MTEACQAAYTGTPVPSLLPAAPKPKQSFLLWHTLFRLNDYRKNAGTPHEFVITEKQGTMTAWSLTAVWHPDRLIDIAGAIP
jgi:hypothetical protein